MTAVSMLRMARTERLGIGERKEKPKKKREEHEQRARAAHPSFSQCPALHSLRLITRFCCFSVMTAWQGLRDRSGTYKPDKPVHAGTLADDHARTLKRELDDLKKQDTHTHTADYTTKNKQLKGKIATSNEWVGKRDVCGNNRASAREMQSQPSMATEEHKYPRVAFTRSSSVATPHLYRSTSSLQRNPGEAKRTRVKVQYLVNNDRLQYVNL